MRVKTVIANWKMHGDLASNAELIRKLLPKLATFAKVRIVVCVPFPYLSQLQSLLLDSGVQLGAQDVSQYELGAFTGEVSASMLQEFDCNYVIVGHSERRSLYGESDALVAEKFAASRQRGLIPILCVGETLEEREAGLAIATVSRQLRSVIENCGINQFQDCIIAYEPVWAIGTGRTATAEQVQEMHANLRQLIAMESTQLAHEISILYGGSIKANNAASLFSLPDVDGGLVGGASLNAIDFAAICSLVAPIQLSPTVCNAPHIYERALKANISI